ncbi:MAG: 2-phospho-L-lactate guanylyltransferase [Novosphingobium sp.]
MTGWVIIPAKGAPAAKGRLAGALSDHDRDRLAQAMLRLAIEAACDAVGADHVLVIGTISQPLPQGVTLLDEPPGGLNAALAHARAEALRRGARRVVSLAADLPRVDRGDVLALINLPQGTAAIAPDRHGTGTNALSLPFPAAAGFAYGYGLQSCPRHEAEAARLGLTLRCIERPGLACDIDEPSDLADARGLLCLTKDD